MDSSVEISMYPLNKVYKSAIIELIKCLRKQPFICIEINSISKRVYDDYKRAVNANNAEMKNTFTKEGKVIFNKTLSEKPQL